MSVWMATIILGKVAATWGPLPYDLAECERRTAVIEADLDSRWESELATAPEMRINGRQLKREDVDMICLVAPARPDLGSPFPAL